MKPFRAGWPLPGGRGSHVKNRKDTIDRWHLLFGGKGSIIAAVLGGLVIAVIRNGLPLIIEASYAQYIVTGLVLLLAATVDALSRRRQPAG